MDEKLEDIIEAVLFALGRYVSFKELSDTLKIERVKIEEACKILKKRYDSENAVNMIYIKDGVQLATNKTYYKYVSLFIENTKKQSLTPSQLETLTIIAYNPKITKAEIEKIRGVNSDFAVSKLLECGLIEEVARLNLPGRPAVYMTTEEFLRTAGIKKLEDLPEYASLGVKDEQILTYELNEE